MRRADATSWWLSTVVLAGLLAAAAIPDGARAQTVLGQSNRGGAPLPSRSQLSAVPGSSPAQRADLAAALKRAAITGAERVANTLQVQAAALRGIAEQLRTGTAGRGDLVRIQALAGSATRNEATRDPSGAAKTLEGTAIIAEREAKEVAAAVVQASNATPAAALTLLQNPANNSLIYTLQPSAPSGGSGALGPQVAVFDQGGPTTHFEDVGLLVLESQGTPLAICSGTLVRPDKVLTAAHCFCPWSPGDPPETVQQCTTAPSFAAVASQWHAYFHFAGLVDIKSLIVDNAYIMSDRGSSDDLAVARLSSAVHIPTGSIKPGLANMVGQYSDVVGFGWSYASKANPLIGAFPVDQVVPPGIKVTAQGLITQCPPGYTGVCWNAGPHVKVTGATCDGDSGGPVMLRQGVTPLVGVTSIGNAGPCSQGGPMVGTDLELPASAAFLTAALGPVGNGTKPFVRILEFAAQPLSATGLFQYTFSAPVALSSMIVAANAPAGSPISLRVIPDSPSSPACAPTIGTHLPNDASCAIRGAAAGQDYVIRVTGPGNQIIQLTAAGFD